MKNNDFGIKIHISDETEKLLDTGGGLKKAEVYLEGDEPILIYNVDIISNLNLKLLLKDHLKTKAFVTLAVRNRETQRYFKFDQNKQLVGWINKKTGESKISRQENLSLIHI